MKTLNTILPKIKRAVNRQTWKTTWKQTATHCKKQRTNYMKNIKLNTVNCGNWKCYSSHNVPCTTTECTPKYWLEYRKLPIPPRCGELFTKAHRMATDIHVSRQKRHFFMIIVFYLCHRQAQGERVFKKEYCPVHHQKMILLWKFLYYV